MGDFADYVVFVDESGDHSLTVIDPEFPVFALSFCVISKADYIATVVPTMQRLKFKYWGHCQRQSKSGPEGSAKCCHFGVIRIAA